MVFPETRFRIRDGRTAVLHSPREADVPSVLEYLRLSASETEFLLRTPEDCGKYTEEGERALFERLNASLDEYMLLCHVGEELAGICQISFKPSLKTRHRATVAIANLKKFWGLGIGTRMFEEMILLAEARQNVTQIELEFIEGNVRARNLYEKMGFRIAAVHPDAIRFPDGRLANEYLMIRKISRDEGAVPVLSETGEV